MKYIPVIGLEVHVELKTKSKMFCRCDANYFGEKPNTHTCPVCLGLPGALPVPNKKAIDWCIMIALALDCKINEISKFDRKNYYYPDLAKGYQISQYDLPFGYDGEISLSSGKKIRIRRVHMEEDTAKLTHDSNDLSATNKISLIDFNRSGVPLVEIVTEPDFNEAAEVKEYLQKLQQIVRYLDVSNADMEKGDMRLEPNISLKKEGAKDLPKYKVEVKNINSFKFVEKAINFEIKRQTEILKSGKNPDQETRGFNENKNITFSQRAKEEANDYRYFPEPDIPPIRFSKSEINKLKLGIGELPSSKQARFSKEYNISEYDSEIITREKSMADYFERCIDLGKKQSIQPKTIANFIINKKINIHEVTPEKLLANIGAQTQVVQVDEKELDIIISKVLEENKKAVEDYKKGKENVIMFLVGQVMRNFKTKIDVVLVKNLILKKI